MCGIAGFVGSGDKTLLERMVRTLHHRGPDENGLWTGGGAALGMQRLAIIDPETGHQPLLSDSGSIVLVFNGEIYNHVELRRELEAKGIGFRTDHSDTEVILRLYEAHGIDFLDRLNGMFAIALWDARHRRLLLARDRAGIKPLYFAHIGRELVFGSEPKALLVHPAIGRTPNFRAIHHYFSFKNIPAPFSAFEDMEQLRPGERLILEDGKIKRDRWWRIRFDRHSTLAERDAAEEVRRLLADSVRLQLRSDVPVAAYLSGGVDSSSVVALMCQQGASHVKTFTLVYEDSFPQKDADRAFARKVSERYGTDHHEHLVTYKDIPQHIDAIASSFDEPFSGVISTYFITEAIARHAKVALSGDGADELFASYIGPRLAAPLAYLAANPERAAADSICLAPFEKQIDWLQGILARGDEAARRMGQYLADEKTKIDSYTPFMKNAIEAENTEDLLRSILASCDTDDPTNRALYIDFETLLPDQVLPFVDRLSMAHSVEVRPPFLDHRLIEFAASLPGSLKIRQGRVKHILKEAVADLLPEGLVDRPKEGFLMPINAWILQNLRETVEDLLSRRNIQAAGIFRYEAIRGLLNDHYAGKRNYGDRIWNLMMFQVWWQHYVDAPRPAL